VTTAEIDVKGHVFNVEGRRTVEPGWLIFYDSYGRSSDSGMPPFKDGETLRVIEIKSEEKFEAPPGRYNQSSLLDKMEREGIGTKATRAEIISTLAAREYVSGQELVPTDLGISVIEVLKLHAPSIVSTETTRTLESGLESVETGAQDQKRLLRDAIGVASDQLASIESDDDAVGLGLNTVVAESKPGGYELGPCPVCKTGRLHVVKSRKSGKRFVGCTNYSAGCRASAPLPQRGTLRVGGTCKHCSWPVVYIRKGRFPWRLCVNPSCPSKGEKRREVRAV